MLHKKISLSRSLIVFSLFLLLSCQDRLFDNPFDPDAGMIILEVINTIQTQAVQPLGLTWDGNTLWNVDGSTGALFSLDRLSGTLVRTLFPQFDTSAGTGKTQD